MVELIDESDATIAQRSARTGVQTRDLHPFDRNRARVRICEPAQDVQQRALARAGTPENRDAVAARDFEVDTAQHRQRLRPEMKRLDHVATLERSRSKRAMNTVLHGAAPRPARASPRVQPDRSRSRCKGSSRSLRRARRRSRAAPTADTR